MAYNTIKLPSSSAPSMSQVRIETFLGVDLTNQASNVDEYKSPNAENMIRDVPGKVRKRMGWHTLRTLNARINGYHPLYGKKSLIHAGTKLYQVDGLSDTLAKQAPTAIYSNMADDRSKSWEFDGKLYIADGKTLLVYDGETVKTAQSLARVPLVTIAKAPVGGGTQYEPLNLLQPKFEERFAGTEDAQAYHLSFSGLDSAAVEAYVLDSGGNWVQKSEGQDFTVDRPAGIVNFNTAPGKSPVSGEDNVKIIASRTVAGYADRINKCRIGIAFGVNGAADRLFLAGNPDFINYDWYSGQNDPTYWGDTDYSVLGQSDSAIMGYSIVNARLAAHKNAPAAERNVILREGNLTDNKPTFPIVNMLQGVGAVAQFSFANLATEPVFLTELGVYAITAADISGEKYAQNRSFFLNGKLLKEQNMKDAFAVVYKDMYWLALNGKAYILDGLQALQTDKSAPYSNRQYAGFLCTGIPARVMWVEDNVLYFGSDGGQIRAFYTDTTSQQSYNDDGAPIYACWTTPDIFGKNFHRFKTFSQFYVGISAAVATSVRAWARENGLWEEQFFDDTTARYFDWSQITWDKWSWSTDTTPQTIGQKIRIKKVDKAAFRVENDALNEPFGLEHINIEFVETGYYK